jgi:hypothetical protein
MPLLWFTRTIQLSRRSCFGDSKKAQSTAWNFLYASRPWNGSGTKESGGGLVGYKYSVIRNTWSAFCSLLEKGQMADSRWSAH